MTNNQIALIKQSLLEEELAEMAVIDALPDEDVVFSEKYKIEIQKLLNKHKKYTRNANRFIPKRLVGVLAAILITLTLMMSISAIRETVVEFIVTVYESFIDVFIEENNDEKTPKEIENKYMPSYEVNGFHIISSDNYEILLKSKWTNYKNEFIVLEQSVLENNYQAFIDNESMDYMMVNLNSYNTYYIEKNSTHCFIWANEDYMFKMLFSNTIEFSEIEKVIESMEIIED